MTKRHRIRIEDDDEPTHRPRRRIAREPALDRDDSPSRRQSVHGEASLPRYNLQTDENGLVVRGPGRPPGTPNRTTALLKNAITGAGEDIGEDGHGKDGMRGYCRWLARNEPNAYVQLLKRILPQQVHTNVDPQSALGQLLEAARAKLTYEKTKTIEARAIEGDTWRREYRR